MRGDRRLEQLGLYCFEGLESTALVLSDEARVAGHICGENCGEAAGLHHAVSPAASRRPSRKSLRCSGLRQCMAFGTTTGVTALSRLMVCLASSSRPICA